MKNIAFYKASKQPNLNTLSLALAYLLWLDFDYEWMSAIVSSVIGLR